MGTYSGFYHLYLSSKGKWQLQYLEGFTETALYFTLDTKNKIWLLSSRGVEQLTIDLTKNQVLSELIIEQNAAQRTYSLTNWQKQVLITSDNHCAIVDTNGIITTDTQLLNQLSGNQRYLNIAEDVQHNVWYIYDNRVSVRPYDPQTDSYRAEQVIWYSDTQFIGGFTNLTPSDRTGVLVGGVDGFYYMVYLERLPFAREKL